MEVTYFNTLQVTYSDYFITVSSDRFNQKLRYKKNGSDNSYLKDTVAPDLKARGFNILGYGSISGENNGRAVDVIVTDTFMPLDTTKWLKENGYTDPEDSIYKLYSESEKEAIAQQEAK